MEAPPQSDDTNSDIPEEEIREVIEIRKRQCDALDNSAVFDLLLAVTEDADEKAPKQQFTTLLTENLRIANDSSIVPQSKRRRAFHTVNLLLDELDIRRGVVPEHLLDGPTSHTMSHSSHSLSPGVLPPRIPNTLSESATGPPVTITFHSNRSTDSKNASTPPSLRVGTGPVQGVPPQPGTRTEENIANSSVSNDFRINDVVDASSKPDSYNQSPENGHANSNRDRQTGTAKPPQSLPTTGSTANTFGSYQGEEPHSSATSSTSPLSKSTAEGWRTVDSSATASTSTTTFQWGNPVQPSQAPPASSSTTPIRNTTPGSEPKAVGWGMPYRPTETSVAGAIATPNTVARTNQPNTGGWGMSYKAPPATVTGESNAPNNAASVNQSKIGAWDMPHKPPEASPNTHLHTSCDGESTVAQSKTGSWDRSHKLPETYAAGVSTTMQSKKGGWGMSYKSSQTPGHAETTATQPKSGGWGSPDKPLHTSGDGGSVAPHPKTGGWGMSYKSSQTPEANGGGEASATQSKKGGWGMSYKKQQAPGPGESTVNHPKTGGWGMAYKSPQSTGAGESTVTQPKTRGWGMSYKTPPASCAGESIATPPTTGGWGMAYKLPTYPPPAPGGSGMPNKSPQASVGATASQLTNEGWGMSYKSSHSPGVAESTATHSKTGGWGMSYKSSHSSGVAESTATHSKTGGWGMSYKSSHSSGVAESTATHSKTGGWGMSYKLPRASAAGESHVPSKNALENQPKTGEWRMSNKPPQLHPSTNDTRRSSNGVPETNLLTGDPGNEVARSSNLLPQQLSTTSENPHSLSPQNSLVHETRSTPSKVTPESDGGKSTTIVENQPATVLHPPPYQRYSDRQKRSQSNHSTETNMSRDTSSGLVTKEVSQPPQVLGKAARILRQKTTLEQMVAALPRWRHNFTMVVNPDNVRKGNNFAACTVRERPERVHVTSVSQSITESSATTIAKRLDDWDPFWKCIAHVHMGITCPVNLSTPKATSISTAVKFHFDPSLVKVEWNGNFYNGLSTVPGLSWGTVRPLSSYKDQSFALLLRMIPLTSKPQNRADFHMWPKGTFLEIGDTIALNTVFLEQRRQQSWDEEVWKGNCRPIDVACYAKRDAKAIHIQIACCDSEQYVYSLSVCQYRSPERLFQILTNPGPESLPRISCEEALTKALDLAKRQMVVLDHSDGVNAEGTLVFSLLCPISKQLLVTPVRSEQCKHWQCFDLQSYLQTHVAISGARWRCGACERFVCVSDLVICEWTASLLKEFKNVASTSRDRIELYASGSYKLLVERKKRGSGAVENSINVESEPVSSGARRAPKDEIIVL